ncbi:MAG TPA: GNAT family N-acetyltransferase [Microvirga sp.]|jgi:GNAT superfamily N-acetyltransferase
MNAELLRRYDADVRRRTESLPPGFALAWDGPILRMTGPDPAPSSNGVLASDLDAATADAAISNEIAVFGALGHAFEWKHFDYDAPSDLDRRLIAAGFEAAEPEMLVAFDVARGFAAPPLPPDLRIERLEDPATFGAIAAVNGTVYGDRDHAHWLQDTIASEKAASPDAIHVYAAFAGSEPVSVGWLRHTRGDAFGSLWGGSTLPAWRGKGVYTALVAARVREAEARGCRWLTVDCSPMSLPILERRGFERLAVTTPYIWRPEAAEKEP